MTTPADPGDRLDHAWAALPPATGIFMEATAVGQWAGGQILAAVDSDSRRHLLVGVPDGSQPQPGRLHGLDVGTRRLRAAGHDGLWVDLALLDDTARGVFTVLSADILATLGSATDAEPTVIGSVISRWRRFWSVSSNGLSTESQLGLFGELWLLTEWLPAVTAAAVQHWRGPLGGRHDFVSDTISVEVKTTGSATGPVVHRVQSLEQLDEPGTGRLYLLSLRIVRDPLGGHTLDRIVHRARTAAAAVGPGTVDDLDDHLSAVGWTPAHSGRYSEQLRLMDQELYEIGPDFPRLTRDSFPDGLPTPVTDVSYTLDVSGCTPWRVPADENRMNLLGSLSV